MKINHWFVVLSTVAFLSACGGVSGSGAASPGVAAPSEVARTAGKITGVAIASNSGMPLANVQVRAGGQSAITAGDGSFSLDNVPGGERVVVHVALDGYADGFATSSVQSGAVTRVVTPLVPVVQTVTFESAAGATVTDAASAARVTLPPASLVDAVTGATPRGPITARIGVINPATDSANMPGDYTTAAGAAIESFGALSVQLTDAGGNRVNLASGRSATIRIPLASRSLDPPPTIPLFYFNESSGAWIEEGTATLGGVAPNQFYEGSVTHFSIWNADIPMDRIFVNGCATDAAGTPLANIGVRTDGIDYSGRATATTDALGKFRVAIRRASRATVSARYPRGSNNVVAGPSETDITLPSCLTVSPSATLMPPVMLAPPTSLTVPVGSPAVFLTIVADDAPLRYQWLRNGSPVNGATQSRLVIPAVGVGDDRAQFSVRISNDAGAVVSDPVTLAVVPAVPKSDIENLLKLLFLFVDLHDMAYAPLEHFLDDNGRWLSPTATCRAGTASGSLNAQPLPVGTALAGGTGSLSGTFSSCRPVRDPGAALTGTSTINFTADAALTTLTASGQVSSFRRTTNDGTPSATDLTGDGTVRNTYKQTKAGALTTSVITISPDTGATLRNNLTSQIARFVSGTTAVTVIDNSTSTTKETVLEQRTNRFSVGGIEYVANGMLRLSAGPTAPLKGSGQISLSRNGFQVGRVFATDAGLFFENAGAIAPFAMAPR